MWPRFRGRGPRGIPRGGNWGPRGGPPRGRGIFPRIPRGGNRGRGFHPNKPKMSREKAYRKENFHNRRQNEAMGVEKLHEIDVGITEYISDLEGFSGILKSRYSDFHVNEIDNNGKEAKLTNLKAPRDPTPPKEEEDDDLLVKRYRIEQLPIETWDRIHKMVQTKNQDELIEIDVTTMTKQDRTKIHEAVKTVFGQKIVGSTVTKDEKKFVIIKLFNKNEKVDLREKWPKHREGEYVYFIVYKEYTDTIEANFQIAEALQMRPCLFNYAGVKDRRAKTTQWFCVRKIDPTRIAERCRYLKNIKVGNFCYKERVLKLGQLEGNRFRIALRNVTAKNEVLEKALESLKETGFINYYGLQRFGNCKDIPTHTVGLQLLRGNFRGAVELILKPRKHEQDREVAKAKSIYEETGDVHKAYEALGKKKGKIIEGKLLNGLCKHSPNDFVNSLENVPRNMRLLYIHAYQSLVWNKIVSRRIKELGMNPIAGDLVVDGELEEVLPFLEPNDEISLDNVDHVNAMERAIQEKGTLPPRVKVKVLTEDDLEDYSIDDIVLPLPGYDVTYPENQVKDWYEAILTEDGLSLEMPKQKVKTYTLSGAYRKILERVENFSWKIMGYQEPTSNLIRSDHEELLGKPEPQDIPDAKYKALILDFCLKPSCYATMALRELMKIDTSVETHMNLDKIVTDSHVVSVATQTASSSNENNANNKETNENNKNVEGDTTENTPEKTTIENIKAEPANGENYNETKEGSDNQGQTIDKTDVTTKESQTIDIKTEKSQTIDIKTEKSQTIDITTKESQTIDDSSITTKESQKIDVKTEESQTMDESDVKTEESQPMDESDVKTKECSEDQGQTIDDSDNKMTDKRKLPDEDENEIDCKKLKSMEEFI